MSYCLGIKTHEGLVMASDSRTSAGAQVNVTQKMHLFDIPGERAFTILTTGSLSLSQSVITLLRIDFRNGEGLAKAPTMYDASRVVGEAVRRVSDLDRNSLERDDFTFNVHMLLGGQIKGQKPELYLTYPQGNPLRATSDTPYIQIGENKYGRPILDRGIHYHNTSLEEAVKYALISIDSTMRSNSTVGPPIDLLVYVNDTQLLSRYRRFHATDPDLQAVHQQWELALRKAVQELPSINFDNSEA